MSEPSSGPSELDARLAEIDRRLRTIQTELAPDDESGLAGVGPGPDPAPPAPPPTPAPPSPGPPSPGPGPGPPPTPDPAPPGPAPDPSPPVPSPAFGPPAEAIRDLIELHEGLLSSMRVLLSAYEAAIARLPTSREGSSVREFTVAAGPFASTESLRRFERTLAAIPDVREVAIRGYEGQDRAIVDVRFNEPRS